MGNICDAKQKGVAEMKSEGQIILSQPKNDPVAHSNENNFQNPDPEDNPVTVNQQKDLAPSKKENKLKNARSIKNFKESEDQQKQILIKQDINTAITLHNIGKSYEKMGDLQKALEYFINSSEICKRQLGENHPSYANILNEVAHIQHKLGDNKSSQSTYNQSQKIYKNIDDKSPEYVNSLVNTANIQKWNKDYNKALEYLDEALGISKQFLKDKCQMQIKVLNELGQVLLQIGEKKKALQYTLQSQELCLETFSKDHPLYVGTLLNIGKIYQANKQLGKALQYYRRALKIYEEQQNKNFEEYGTILINIGNVYAEMGQPEIGKQYYETSQKLIQEKLGENHPLMAVILNSIGRMYQDMGQLKKSIPYFNRCEQIYKNQKKKENV